MRRVDETLLLIERLQIRAGRGRSLSTILDSLRDGVYVQQSEIQELRKRMPPDLHDFVDDEWATFERAVYAAAFVTYQPYIHDVAVAAVEVRRHLNSSGKPPGMLPETRFEVMDLMGSPSPIRQIHALANYVKHAESWGPNEWHNPSYPETVKVLKEMGLAEGDPDLLRSGARKLNIPSAHMVGNLSSVFVDWSSQVVEAARGDAGLPPRHRVGA